VGLTRGCFDETTSSSCRLLVVVADGRRLGWSIGMTTSVFARALARLGAYEAINLDGGASSQVLFRGRSLNRVAPGARRAVVSALLMRRRPVAAVLEPRPVARW
jgi:exopolysaccharide biosynthesis protein